MKSRSFTTIIAIFIYCSVFVPKLEAQSYRKELEVAPTDVYKAVFDYIEKKDYEKIRTALVYISPVIDTLKNKFGVGLRLEIETALQKKDVPSLNATIRKLVFYDLLDTFYSIVKEGNSQPQDKLQAWLKMAYLDYLFLSPTIVAEKKGFVADQEIKKIFKKAHAALGEYSPYTKGEKGSNLMQFAEYANQIEGKCLELFPEFESTVTGKRQTEP
jgi:hypothetical protein